MTPRQVAYLECLPAQEAVYWEARRRGWNLSDKAIGDLLRIAGPLILEGARADVVPCGICGGRRLEP